MVNIFQSQLETNYGNCVGERSKGKCVEKFIEIFRVKGPQTKLILKFYAYS